jgi:hypothetical protein
LSVGEGRINAEGWIKQSATSGNNEIYLVDKQDGFIRGNRHMWKFFGMEMVFVWCSNHVLIQ